MSFEAWLLLISLKVSDFCDSFIVPRNDCREYVMDCVLDGEDIEWCKNDYIIGEL